VIGVPDNRLGEELCAWIKLTDGSRFTANDIKEFIKNKVRYNNNN
jgi:fatty-acyl-CoA synthase